MLSQSAKQGSMQFSDLVDKLSIRRGNVFLAPGQDAGFAGRVHVTLLGASSITTAEGLKLTSTELREGADLEPSGKGVTIARYLDHSGNERNVKVSGIANPAEARYEIKVNRDVVRSLAVGSQEE